LRGPDATSYRCLTDN